MKVIVRRKDRWEITITSWAVARSLEEYLRQGGDVEPEVRRVALVDYAALPPGEEIKVVEWYDRTNGVLRYTVLSQDGLREERCGSWEEALVTAGVMAVQIRRLG